MAAALPPNPPLPPVFTVEDALINCGISDTIGVAAVDRRSNANRISDEMFDGQFETFKDITYKDLVTDLRTYSELTAAEGRIRLTVRQKKNIRALLQWVKDEYRYGRDPSSLQFPVDQVDNLIRRNKTHDAFIEKSRDLVNAAEPEKFKSTMKWSDWKPTFINYLRLIPGRDGIPLSYICRENDDPDPTPQPDFLDEYVNIAPLTGDAYEIDNLEVMTYLMKYITDNETAESTVQATSNIRDGRSAFKALMKLYEGIGLHGVDITKADLILQNLYYHGEKKPHMWWTEFEKQLTWAFGVFDKHEKRVVFSNEQRLRTLLKKVKADFLEQTKSSIDVELSKVPVIYQYNQALQCFRNKVNKEFPPMLINSHSGYRRVNRNVNQVMRGGRHGGRGYQGRGRGGGRYEHRNSGRGGRGTWINKTRNDSKIATLVDGSKIELHPSFYFSDDVIRKMKKEDYEWMVNERREYRKRQNDRSSERSVRKVRKIGDQQSYNSAMMATPSLSSNSSTISSNNTSTIMGGRNEQAAKRGSSR